MMKQRSTALVAGVGPGAWAVHWYATMRPMASMWLLWPATHPDSRTWLHRERGPLVLTVFNAGGFQPGRVVDPRPEDFEHCLRVGYFGGFLVGRHAARAMLASGEGSLTFTGATASLRGGANFANLASPRFALCAPAQSMPRELDLRPRVEKF